MSEENVDVVREIYAANQRRDWQAARELYDPDVVLEIVGFPDGGRYEGRDALVGFFRRWFGTWDQLDLAPERFIDAGDRVVVLVRITGVGKGSGVTTSIRTADVMTVRAGAVVHHVGYADVAAAMAAAGLEA